MKRQLTGLMLALTILLMSPVTATAQEYPEPSAALCSIYRQGPVVHRRMPVYFGAPSEDPNSFYWIDVWFRPEYLNSSGFAGLPRPDGLPDRDLLLNINIEDGQPVPLEYRRSARPQEDGFYSLLLLGGLQHKPIASWLAIFANWNYRRVWAGEIPDFTTTGEVHAGMEVLDVPSMTYYNWDTRRETLFADLSDTGQITAVMSCYVYGTVPVPHCQLKEKSQSFEMSISGFRRNQLDQLEIIRKHARNFTACLTWEGE